MSITPMYVGDSGPIIAFQLTTDGGSNDNLSGIPNSAFTMWIKDVQRQSLRKGGGSFNNTGANGIVNYTFGPNDTQVYGPKLLYVQWINAGQQMTDGPLT